MYIFCNTVKSAVAALLAMSSLIGHSTAGSRSELCCFYCAELCCVVSIVGVGLSCVMSLGQTELCCCCAGFRCHRKSSRLTSRIKDL